MKTWEKEKAKKLKSQQNIPLILGVQLALTISPEGAASGGMLPTQPLVAIRDAQGNTVNSSTGQVVGLSRSPSGPAVDPALPGMIPSLLPHPSPPPQAEPGRSSHFVSDQPAIPRLADLIRG